MCKEFTYKEHMFLRRTGQNLFALQGDTIGSARKGRGLKPFFSTEDAEYTGCVPARMLLIEKIK